MAGGWRRRQLKFRRANLRLNGLAPAAATNLFRSNVDTSPVRLLFLFADVGGGHRAPAEAVREALARTVGEAAQVELVDMLADYAPFPFNRGQQTYTQAVRFARTLQGWFFHAIDGRLRIRLGAGILWRPMQRATRELMIDHPADLVVWFDTTYSFPLTWLHIPCAFVFTDLITNHALWCAPGAKQYLVPTDIARDRAIRRGVPSDKISVSGLPVHPRFLDPIAEPRELRARLGATNGKPIILLTGGGEGLGRVYHVAHAIGESGLDAQLVVITGRNHYLRAQLEEVEWPMETTVLGYTRDMLEWMAIADVLITKSGSNTLAEGLVRGLPMILFDFVPGQEEGNPQYIVDSGAGAYCPRPAQVVATLRDWFSDRRKMLTMSENARRIARPNAAYNVARIVFDLAREAAVEPVTATGDAT
jgi:1,2-diacylglycerol 3-beta-galactosyltransferase